MTRLYDIIKEMWPMSLTATGPLASLTATGILQIIGWVVTIVAGIISIAMMWERRRFYRREHQLRHQNRYKYTGKTHNYGS
jgi:hypothetical protein